MKIKGLHIKNQVKAVDDVKGIVTVAISHYGNKDSDGDVIQNGAFKKTVSENFARFKHLKNHMRDQNIGKPIELFDDENNNLIMVSQLNLNTQIGKETYEEYKLGQITEHSIGFNIVKGDYSKSEDAYIIQEAKLWEGSSLTAWGANEMTHVQDVKNMNEQDFVELYKKMTQYDELFKQYDIEKLFEYLNTMHSKSIEPPTSTHKDDEPLDWTKVFILKINQ